MRSRRLLAIRLAATVGILSFAALAFASGMDRLSSLSPGLARLVPEPARAQAERTEARLALAMMKPERAVAAAEAAVAADPVVPDSTALLGTALLLARQFDAAEQAFRVAARFGWREPMTQRYWFEAAIQAGDYESAADRADAMLRAQPRMPEAERLLAPLASTSQGRAALLARMARRPQWLSFYAGSVGDLSDEAIDRRSELLIALAERGTQLGCAETRSFVDGALKRGAREQAEGVWTAHCPGAEPISGLADGGFEQLASPSPSPFGWTARRSGDLSIRMPENSEGGHFLRLRSTASVSRLVLEQALSLSPGRYRLTGMGTAGRFAASLGCDRSPEVPSGVRGDLAAGGQELRVQACERLMLGIWLRPGSSEAELDDLKLERIG